MSYAATTPELFDLPEGIVSKQEKPVGMSATEKQEFADRIKALSNEELQIVVDNIPVEMCMQRIQNELSRASKLEQEIAKTMKLFKSPSA